MPESAAVFVANPDGTPLVIIATDTVPGATLFDCDGISAAVERNVLTGNEVPLKFAVAEGTVHSSANQRSRRQHLRRILIDKVSSLALRSRCRQVALTFTTVEPVCIPVHVP